MFRVRFICLLTTIALLFCFSATVTAAQVDCDSVYCFGSEDFSQKEDPLLGICITQLPDAGSGTVFLGTRIVQKGDILTADQVAQMTFSPLLTEQDATAQIVYLPIYEDRVERAATMTLSIRGKKDAAPIAADSSIETYKNIPNQSKLKVSDPEGKAMTYSLLRKPKRGDVVINEDGTFVYTPKKNKVGVDSFTFTATDPAGNVSREATVTIQILKPTGTSQYTDTATLDCRFEAEWLKNTGLFEGERINGALCFFPEKEVTRGQFLAMVVKVLDIPCTDTGYEALPSDTPDWLKPYLAAAMRAGLTADLPQTDSFGADIAITGAEAAVILQNALDLTLTEDTLSAYAPDEEVPAWAKDALAVLSENALTLPAGEMTRAQTACALYVVNTLKQYAPGTAVFKMQ